MRIVKEEKFNILYADDNKHIRAIDETPTEEQEVNYFTMAYVPKTVDEVNINNMYVEEDITSETEIEQKAQAYDILVGDSE